MKLEELAGALTELKEKLFISIQEESAAEANEALLSELRERIMTKQPEQIKKKNVVQKQIIKSTDKKLNEQQSKFLKTMPEEEMQAEPQEKRSTTDSIQLQKSSNGYTISIDRELPQHVKNLAKITDSDTQQYKHTIAENAKEISFIMFCTVYSIYGTFPTSHIDNIFLRWLLNIVLFIGYCGSTLQIGQWLEYKKPQESEPENIIETRYRNPN